MSVRDRFLKAASTYTRRVQIGDDTFLVRPLTLAGGQAVSACSSANEKAVMQIIDRVVDESGNPVFTEDDMDFLMTLPSDMVLALIAGDDVPSVEEAAKN